MRDKVVSALTLIAGIGIGIAGGPTAGSQPKSPLAFCS
jgi:hypothetical protein